MNANNLFTLGLTTEQLAHALNLRANTIRAALCKKGSYFGEVPTKCPNGRLIWPAASIERLTSGSAVRGA